MFRVVKKIANADTIKARLPMSGDFLATKRVRDEIVAKIIRGEDKRLLFIIGPCSAHDPKAVVEYISRLGKIQDKLKEKVVIVPRIYTGKPRTKGEGYKGIFHQPDPTKPADLEAGVLAVRQMHKDAFEVSGLTCADEMLYPDNYAYVDDLLTYVTIGARSSENQQHRLVGSGVDVALGVKNPMHGSMSVLINSIYSAQIPNEFKYNSKHVSTSGNPLAHAVLRGYVDDNGTNFANYHFEDIVRLSDAYQKSELKNPSIIIDTNHSNSDKKPLQQPRIIKEVLTNCKESECFGRFVRGFMVESFIEDGAQRIEDGIYGKSITDGCLGWDKSERMLFAAAEAWDN